MISSIGGTGKEAAMESGEDRIEADELRIGRRLLLSRALGIVGATLSLSACKHLSLGTTAPREDEPSGGGDGGGGPGGADGGGAR